LSTRCTLDYSRPLKPTRSWRREKRFGWPDRGQTGVRLTARRGGTNIFRDALGSRYLAGCEFVSTGELHESAPPGVLKGSFMSCCLEEREREGRGDRRTRGFVRAPSSRRFGKDARWTAQDLASRTLHDPRCGWLGLQPRGAAFSTRNAGAFTRSQPLVLLRK
jgi:hypothetical protein